MKFFRLRTSRDEIVCADAITGRLVNIQYDDLEDRHIPIVTARLTRDEHILYAASAGLDALPIRCGDAQTRWPLLPLLARWTGRNDIYNLVSFDSGLYLCARPVSAEHREHVVTADRPEARGWEEFRLTEVVLPERLDYLRMRFEALQPILDKLVSDGDLEAGLSDLGPDEADFVNGITPMLGEERLERFAQEIWAAPSLASRLKSIFPQDIWATSGIPHLVTRDIDVCQDETEIDASFDILADAGLNGHYASFPHACASAMRRLATPTKNVCIVATARNEGLYLLEWLAYHRLMGFERFFLYSNDNDDGSDELLSALSAAGEITWIHNLVADGGLAQMKAYGHAFSILPDILDYRWCLTIDLDEFFVVNPERFSSVRDFIDWQEREETDAIALNWVIVGPDGNKRWDDAPVTRRFHHQVGDPPVDSHVKSLCRPQKFIHSEPHFPIAPRGRDFVFRDSTTALHSHEKASAHAGHYGKTLSDNPNRDYACIYHYFFKSAEEFLWKFSRNRGDYAKKSGRDGVSITKEFVQNFMEFFTPDHASRNDWIDRCAPGLDEEMARLKTLPGVSEALDAVKMAFHARVAEFKPIFAEAQAVKDAGAAGEAFLALLSEESSQ